MEMSDPKVAVTGASGFVGRALVSELQARDIYVRPLLRQKDASVNIAVGDIGPDTDWFQALENINCVVHLAALVHVMSKSTPEINEKYRDVNVDATLHLARQAAKAGVHCNPPINNRS